MHFRDANTLTAAACVPCPRAVNGVGWVTYGLLTGALGPEGNIWDPNAMTIWVPNITAFLFGSYYW